ncbi:MAG: hypothetical protein L0K34_09655 [Ancrocorticia sp.]|nr:hypothetical protein [Ancrocorticia sp.]
MTMTPVHVFHHGGTIAAFIAGPLLAVSSFATLCLIALAALVPVTGSLVRRRR